MKALRTDAARFENLPGYDFAPNYSVLDDLEGGSLQMHYVDEGKGEVVLCLHGQPSWSYLYRKMIPILVDAGHRVIAPDLIGFGKSDKPTLRENYTYANHVAWLKNLLTNLDLNNITMICQDWGGLIGLRTAAEMPDRFARIVAANTGLPDAIGVPDEKIADISASMRAYYESLPVPANAAEMGAAMAADTSGMGFLNWVKFCDQSAGFVVGDVLNSPFGGGLTDGEIRAYNAPFPDDAHMAGARQFPSLVPIMPDNPAIAANRAAWQVLSTWEKPFLTAFSDSDPVTAGGDVRFQKTVPGASGQPHVTIKNAGHFLQEHAPEALAAAAIKLIADNPV